VQVEPGFQCRYYLPRFFFRGVISPVPSQVLHLSPRIFPVPRHTGHIFAGDLGEDDIKGESADTIRRKSQLSRSSYQYFVSSSEPPEPKAIFRIKEFYEL